MSTAGFIISILSFLFGAFIYFKHDKKLKEQARILYGYQIEKVRKETAEQQKAELKVYLTNVANVGSSVGSHSGILTIKNLGKGAASRVSIKTRMNLPEVYS